LFLLFALLSGEGESAAISSCHLTEKQVEHILHPVLVLVRGGEITIPKENGSLPSECTEKVSKLTSALIQLERCKRIVHPDEEEDSAILELRLEINKNHLGLKADLKYFLRYHAAAKAFDDLKSVSDPTTVSLLTHLEPELQQVKVKLAELKSSPEHSMLRLIFSDEAVKAANDTELLDNKAKFVARVYDLGLDPYNATFAKYLLEYAYQFDSFDLSVASYKQILAFFKKHDKLREPQLLLLYFFLDLDAKHDQFNSQTEEIKKDYAQFAKDIEKYKETLIKELISDISNSSFGRLSIGLQSKIDLKCLKFSG